MHHYEGAAGAERLVSLAFADGEVVDFFTTRKGVQMQWQIRKPATMYYWKLGIEGWWEYGFWHPPLPYGRGGLQEDFKARVGMGVQ